MRTTSENSPPLSTLTDTAVARGIIDVAQRDALRALAEELQATAQAPTPRQEARSAFNVITVAYALGALLVLFALGWFLAERWTALGPSGVLIVAGLYAIAFAAAGLALRHRGFTIAGGLAVVLAVAMTPVWGWAVLRLSSLWPDPLDFGDPLARFDPYIASRLIIVELATIGVALVALRRIRFSGLAAPIAIAFVALLVHLGEALGDPRLEWYVGPYYLLVIACTTLAIAYAVDRRQPPSEDYALWFYLAGSVMLFAGYANAWSHIGAWRHAMPLVAVALVAASLYLRRRVLVIAGGVAAFGYLGYLAFDVFRRVVALPIALAALGLLVIVATVWMQRRFPSLVARVNRDDDGGRKTLPTGPIAVLGPLAIALTAMLFAMGEARERTEEQDWRNAFYNRRARREIQAQQAAERARRAPPPADTAR
jgi:hypothetical protein